MIQVQAFERLFKKHPELTGAAPDNTQAYEILAETFRNSGKLLVCGNGGCAADIEHIIAELMKGFILKRPIPDFQRTRLVDLYPINGHYLADHLQGALPAISLTSSTAFITAFANDVAADMVFAQQVFGYGYAGDALLRISTSGNSKNVLHALQVANALRLHTIGLTGAQGGMIQEFCEVLICVPEACTAEIQEQHAAIYHALCERLESDFFGLPVVE